MDKTTTSESELGKGNYNIVKGCDLVRHERNISYCILMSIFLCLNYRFVTYKQI
jgi:hypothetical protein